MMKFLFKHFVELTGSPISSSLLKAFTSSRLSRPLIRPYAKVFSINKTEIEYPINNYKTLHEFFTRRLQANVRSVNPAANLLVSPVDGVLSDMGRISPDERFYIKEHLYNVKEMLGSTTKAATYQGGYFFVLYLSPAHYHRIHYPIKGKLISRYALGEKSFPVNNLGMRWGSNPFSTNYRLISELSTNYGKIAFIKVGAMNINSIQLINSSNSFEKGDELGYFSFGSTVILFVEKDLRFTPVVKRNTNINVGQPIGKWNLK